MPNALDKPESLSRVIDPHARGAAAVREIFDFLEDFFVFADAFNSQLNGPQKIVYQRFRDTAAFRHDMLIATRLTPPIARERQHSNPNGEGR